jgi:hypothetical protein
MSETTPLNEWPIDSLYRLSAMLKGSIEYDTIPHDPKWAEFIKKYRSTLDQAIKDAEQTLLQLPF